MLFDNNKNKGRTGLALGIAYYGANGYTVCMPLNDTQWYDFLIEKDGIIQTVQCKSTASQDHTISLRSMGGTKGIVYDRVVNHDIDFLFCVDFLTNTLYNIPLQEIKKQGNTAQIKLKTEPNANNQGFETYKYIVTI